MKENPDRGGRNAMLTRRRALAGFGGLVVGAGMGRATRSAAADTLRFGLTPVLLTNDLELLDRLEAIAAAVEGLMAEIAREAAARCVRRLIVADGGQSYLWIAQGGELSGSLPGQPDRERGKSFGGIGGSAPATRTPNRRIDAS
jgi:phosphonate transport system substrate-binding protein